MKKIVIALAILSAIVNLSVLAQDGKGKGGDGGRELRQLTGILVQDPDIYVVNNGRVEPAQSARRDAVLDFLQDLSDRPVTTWPWKSSGYYAIQFDGGRYLIKPYQFQTKSVESVKCEELVLSQMEDSGSVRGSARGCSNE